MPVMLDMSGSNETGEIQGEGLFGSMIGDTSAIQIISSQEVDITLSGISNVLYVDQRTPGGCEGVTLDDDRTSVCDDNSTYNFDEIGTVTCGVIATPVTVQCSNTEVPDTTTHKP